MNVVLTLVYSSSQVGGYNLHELNMIASEPKPKHVFTVSDFSALDGLKATLEETIAIEGTFSLSLPLRLVDLHRCSPVIGMLAQWLYKVRAL